MIKFNCKCGYTIKVDDKLAGKKGKCPKCKSPIEVPQLKNEKEEQTSTLISVFCGKCKYKQKIPKKLLHKSFICENCQSSTLPYINEQEIASSQKEKTINYTRNTPGADYSENSYYNSNQSNIKRSQRYNNYNSDGPLIFDVTFERFLSLDLLRALYVIYQILWVIGCIVGFFILLGNDQFNEREKMIGFGGIILVYFLGVFFIRVLLELWILPFKMNENLTEIKNRLQ